MFDMGDINVDKKEFINWFIIIGIIALILSTTLSSIDAYKSRRLCNQLRERITEAEDVNRQLTSTVGQCKSISDDLGESVERNIKTAREAVELIEEIRVQVQSLESICGDFDWDSYYDYWDSYLEI